MGFYKSIADFYDFIFPLNKAQLTFINSYLKLHNDNHILEAGCGTGLLTGALSHLHKHVSGIDIDPKMIEKAIEKKIYKDSGEEYYEMNILEMDKNFKESSFDLIASFGNTLVHLNGLSEVEEFITQCKHLLKPQGVLLIQILNYDYICGSKLKSLPLIDNSKVKFERFYNYPENKEKIEFNTRLTTKNFEEKIENTIELFPLKKDTLADLLTKHGFAKPEFYSSFKKDPLNEKSIPLIAATTKQ